MTYAMTLADLAQQLVSDPFNAALRLAYVDALLAEGRSAEAQQQLGLLIKQEPDNADYRQRLARLSEPPALAAAPAPAAPAPAKLALVSSQALPDRSNVVSLASSGVVRFADIAGMHEVKKVIRRKIIDPFVNPGLFARFKKKAGGGVLLYGPPGCGKTMIAKAIANECHAAFYPVGISEILNMYVGQSEAQLSSLFERARDSKPAVLFFDELDALAYSRSKAHSDHTRTLVNEFLHQLDGSTGDNEQLLILGSTNMPWDVDDAMKRPGRFDRQIFVPPLDDDAKLELLKLRLVEVPCEELDLPAIVHKCRFFSGADMDGLIEEAKDVAIDAISEANSSGAAHDKLRALQQGDFLQAVERIHPTTLDWLKTAGNLVKYGNAGGVYKEVESYLRASKLY